jgi:DNA invertase Pin-like site-specific DNA recombinase
MYIQSTADPVVAYLRKSTLRQEDSIPSQREQVASLALREGIKVAREYTDEGIAGDDLDGRPGLQAMLADVRAGKVKTIIVDEFSRLSRADPVTTIADVIRPLKTAGVTLLTAKDGPVSWDNLAGLLMLTIRSDQTSEEVKALSYRILRSAKLASAEGRRRGGRAPYGYRLDRDTGNLLPVEPAAELVRQIFAWCLAGRSPTSIAETLNRLGHVSPSASWSKASVRDILANPVYAGHLCWGRRPKGKHNRFIGGEIVPAAAGQPKVNGADGWHVTGTLTKRWSARTLSTGAQIQLARRRTGKSVDRAATRCRGCWSVRVWTDALRAPRPALRR